MPWVRVPVQALLGGFAQHCIFHANKETTWPHCQFHKVLCAASKTYDGGIQLNRLPPRPLTSHGERDRPEHVPLGICERNTQQTLRSIFRNRPSPGVNLIGGALLQFTAQVQWHFNCLVFPPKKWHLPRAICFTRIHALQVRWEVRNDGSSSQPGDIEKHFEVWEGKVLRSGSVRGAAKVKTFETALGLNQAASQASQPGPAAATAGPPAADGGGGTDAAGPPAADGGGGGGTDTQVIELVRKISAMEAQIEKLEQRNGILEKSTLTPNSKYAPVMNNLKQRASSSQN